MSAALPLLVALLEVYAAGDIADCGKSAAAESVAARTAGLIPPGATVFVLGDTTYPLATAAALKPWALMVSGWLSSPVARILTRSSNFLMIPRSSRVSGETTSPEAEGSR